MATPLFPLLCLVIISSIHPQSTEYSRRKDNRRGRADLECLQHIVLESPVRSGYLVPRGSNQDRDRLGFVPKPKIT
ncbi:hypothetical protein BYT27DRAFT_7282289 [Phlegmacium glaucopus]|nr:hypothetical protein BYT27DRAFT_7282289 [Phlegmacium glaucopus]